MARYPAAEWRPLDKPQYLLTTPDICCLHTMVGSLAGTDRYFRTVSVFSHFGVGGAWGPDVAAGLDGVVYQWGDTRWRNASNLDGNHRVIGVETADNGARPIQPWTTAQQAAIVGLLVWVHQAHDIPLTLIPDSKPGRRGIGYHRQGCDPYRVAGGELWSSAYAKDCPTQARIDQIPGLIERARDIVNRQESGMSAEDVAAVNAHTDEVAARYYRMLARAEMDDRKIDPTRFRTSLAGLDERLRSVLGGQSDLDTILAGVRGMVESVRASTDLQGDDEASILAKLAEIEALLPPPAPAPELTP